MKKISEQLYINEDDNKWFLSWGKPSFQGGDEIEISKQDADLFFKTFPR